MRYAFCLTVLLIAAVLLQLAVAPAFLPPVLQPDCGMLIAMAVLAMAPREFGLVAVFVLGVQADLFGSARMGMLTLAYLLAAGTVLLMAWRELTRGEVLAAWIGAAVGTALAHFYYVMIARLCGYSFAWGPVTTALVSLFIAALVWGLPCAMIVGRWLYWTHTLTPSIRERWLHESRLKAARKGTLRRA